MQIRIAATVRPGDYPLSVTTGIAGPAGGRRDRPGRPDRPHHPGPQTLTGHAVLHVQGDADLAFTLSGDVPDTLVPGLTSSIDLVITNPGPRPIRISALTVAVDHLDDGHAACPVSGTYVVTPFRGDYLLLVVPPGQSRSLSQLGVPPEQRPQLSMLETDADQTACLSATLTLAYTGTGIGL